MKTNITKKIMATLAMVVISGTCLGANINSDPINGTLNGNQNNPNVNVNNGNHNGHNKPSVVPPNTWTTPSTPIVKPDTVPSVPIVKPDTVPSVPVVKPDTVPSVPVVKPDTVPSVPLTPPDKVEQDKEVQTVVKEDKTHANKVGASASALAGLHPVGFDKDHKLTVSVATGWCNGENAFATGVYYQPNENMLFHVSTVIGGENMGNMGASFKL